MKGDGAILAFAGQGQGQDLLIWSKWCEVIWLDARSEGAGNVCHFQVLRDTGAPRIP
jgi:hypothetical protein